MKGKEPAKQKILNPLGDDLSADELAQLNELLNEYQDSVKVRKKIVHGSDIKLTHSFINMGGKYYVIENTLGAGSGKTKVKALPFYFEKVNGEFVRKKEEGEGVIIKVISNSGDDRRWETLQKDAMREYNSLKLSGDTNAELIIDEDRQKIYIKQSKKPGVSLGRYLEENKDFSLLDRLCLIEKIAEEVNALHAKGIAHIDIHDGNIMIDSKGNPHIIDFGSAVPLCATFTSKDNEREHTMAVHRPLDYSDNTPIKIDHYILAGVFGNILGAPDVKVFEEGSSIQRIVRDAQALHLNNSDPNAIQNRLKKRAYQFDKVANVYHDAIADKMIELLKQLGNEVSNQRMDLREFAGEAKVLVELAALNSTPINRLTGGQRKELLRKLNSVDLERMIMSTKPAARALGFAISSLYASNARLDKSSDTIIKLIENAIDESVAKQKDGYGFFAVRRFGGSNVLREILSLPKDILKDVDPEKIKSAEKFSKHVFSISNTRPKI